MLGSVRGFSRDLRLEFFRLRRRAGFWWLLALSQFLMLIVGASTIYEPLDFFLTKPDGIIPPYYYPVMWVSDASVYSQIGAALLMVLAFGPDYGAGTYRTLYSRGAGRLRVPLVKVVMVYLLASASWLVWTLVSLGLGAHFWSATSVYGRVLIEVGADLTGFGDWFAMFLRSMVALLAYCLFAASAVSLFRGTALGLTAVLGMLFMEYVGLPVFSLLLTALYSYDLTGYYTWAVTLALDRFVEWPSVGFWNGAGLLAAVVGYLGCFVLVLWFCYARRDVLGRA